jgi:hypothetical protein
MREHRYVIGLTFRNVDQRYNIAERRSRVRDHENQALRSVAEDLF